MTPRGALKIQIPFWGLRPTSTKYGVLGLKFGLHFKYKIFYLKIWTLRGPIQDDQGTQWKGTCEGDRWPGFSLFAKFCEREIF
jgi:hypothetical protein